MTIDRNPNEMLNWPARRRFVGGLAAAAAGLPVFSPSLARTSPPIRVAGVYTVPVQQRWVNAVHSALLNSVVRGDITYEYRDQVSVSDYEFTFVRYSEGEIDLVVGDAFAHEERARVLAGRYPGKAFLMGSSYKSDARFPNFAVFDNYIQDASYLTGLVAAGMSTNGVLGIIGRFNFPGINRLINAFMDGASEIRSDIGFLIDFVGSWHDLERAQRLAQTQIDGGADVIYADAIGPAEIASRAGVPVIGTISELHPGGEEAVVTSAIWRFGPTVEIAIERLKAGSFSAADYGIYSHMSHGGCALAPINAHFERIGEATMERVALRESQIRMNKFAAKVDNHDPIARYQAELKEIQ